MSERELQKMIVRRLVKQREYLRKGWKKDEGSNQYF
jgi:hypothetical protein